MKPFANEVALIVGGSSGIGRETALLLAERGASVVLLARGMDRLQEAAEEIRRRGGEAEILAADVSSREEMEQAARRLAERFGRLDILVYSAAVFYLSPVETMDLALARQSMEINYWGAVQVTQSFLPLIRKGRRQSLLYVSSLSVPCTPPFFTAYASSKHALRGFVLALRQELRPEGIHVGMVSPGPVDTPLIEKDLHRELYRLPPGIPVLQPRPVAEGIVKALRKRKKELILPRRMTLAAWLAQASPSLVEWYYRLTIPGWDEQIRAQSKRPTI
jgi:NAD(P)-dependent dehydrogenase (short-subunit alcohol dehydrogenase family)